MDLNFAFGLGGIIGTIIGAIGLALYLRDRKRVEVRYEFLNDILIGEKAKPLPNEITIHFRDEILTNLKKANLILWNRSTQSIRETDLSRPFKIEFTSDTKILTINL